MQNLRPYIRLARLPHWFKNIFMVPGIIAVFVLEPQTRIWDNAIPIISAFLAAGLIASSNYVINEILDARTDRFHPLKQNRPMVSGEVSTPIAYVEWLGLAILGLGLGATISTEFLIALSGLWAMGLVYNIPPVRTKELPYLDVLSEAVNNPLRLLLGWYGAQGTLLPPSSFLLAYWMAGAFLMTAKRLAEYRTFSDGQEASSYRSSFSFYNERRLATAMLTYASGTMFLVGVILVKYHIEFILACPLLMLYFAYYSTLTYRKNSIVQNPESLYKDPPLMALTVLLALSFWALSFAHIPAVGEWLGITGTGW